MKKLPPVGASRLSALGAETTNVQPYDQVVKELAVAKQEIARKDEELNQSRLARLTVERGLGPAEISDPTPILDASDHTIATLQNALNAATRGPNARVPSVEASLGANAYIDANIWSNANRAFELEGDQNASNGLSAWNNTRNLFNNAAAIQQQTIPVNINGRSTNLIPIADLGNLGPAHLPSPAISGRPVQSSTPAMYPMAPMTAPCMGQQVGTALDYMPVHASQSANLHGFQAPRHSLLSPTAAEFSYDPNNNAWVNSVAVNTARAGCSTNAALLPPQPPLPPTSQDLAAACDWHAMIERVVYSNDQQCSILLQQKVKGDDAERFLLCECMLLYCGPLITNRFGNFLVQRVLEVGTESQIYRVTQNILGKVVILSMDPFGCHVVQKAFDTVHEDTKETMIIELLRNIGETIIHRYSCHVWQKLFEMRWRRANPIPIMDFVNNALRGNWKSVAKGETGSLVCQNIFENCTVADKRMCVDEVLANMDEISRGQYGNWCIQHICEQGQEHDRVRAFDHIIEYAVEYSMDQYASKVVEKCLKIESFNFLARYLERVCRQLENRPRIPLIDIAGDQYGNYLVQFILVSALPHQKDLVVRHIR